MYYLILLVLNITAGAPTAWLDPAAIHAVPGEEHFFVCGARSAQPVAFEWRRIIDNTTDELLDRSDLPHILITDLDPVVTAHARPLYKSILRFYRIEPEHAGSYKCVVIYHGHERREVVGDVLVSREFEQHKLEGKQAEKTFLIVMISIVFVLLVLGVAVVAFMWRK